MNQNYPLLDGSMVYQARALYGVLYGNCKIFADNCDKTDASGNKNLEQNLQEEAAQFNAVLVYPNPNLGTFYIYSTTKVSSVVFYTRLEE